MTNVLAAAYPDIFKAGIVDSGVPAGCFSLPGQPEDSWNSQCSQGQLVLTGQQWAQRVYDAYPGYTGARPKMQVWHGTACVFWASRFAADTDVVMAVIRPSILRTSTRRSSSGRPSSGTPARPSLTCPSRISRAGTRTRRTAPTSRRFLPRALATRSRCSSSSTCSSWGSPRVATRMVASLHSNGANEPAYINSMFSGRFVEVAPDTLW